MATSKLPSLSGKRTVKALLRAGFVVARVAGSHHVLTLPGNVRRTVTVPVHGDRDLKRSTLRSILTQAGLSVDEFINLLR